jgi:hypothetical protein
MVPSVNPDSAELIQLLVERMVARDRRVDEAVDLRQRAKRREYVEATGWGEAEALRDLAGLLRAWNVQPVEGAADYNLIEVHITDPKLREEAADWPGPEPMGPRSTATISHVTVHGRRTGRSRGLAGSRSDDASVLDNHASNWSLDQPKRATSTS